MFTRFIWTAMLGLMACTVAATPPNFIVIMADDLGAECIGAYGTKDYETPHLDRLAAEGTLFEHAHAQPLCTPSRVKIMTGLRNDRNYDVFGVLPKGEKTFGHMLQDAGYETAVVGKWQLLGREKNEGKGQMPGEAGFDDWFLWQLEARGERYAEPELVEKGGTTTVRTGEYGPALFSDWIDDYIKRERDKPFFLYFPMALVHDPFTPTPDSEIWEEEKRRNEDRVRHFGGMVAYMDKMVGRIADGLQAAGIAENTLLIFTGDNGTHKTITTTMEDGREIQGAKRETIDTGTHVPMIAWQPGTVKAGQRSERLISLADYLPTLAEAVGIPQEERPPTDGRSFLATLRGEPSDDPEFLAFHYHPGKGDYPTRRWVRTAHFKLYSDGRFYDTKADRLEEKPIAGDALTEELAAIRAKLQAELNALGWQEAEATK